MLIQDQQKSYWQNHGDPLEGHTINYNTLNTVNIYYYYYYWKAKFGNYSYNNYNEKYLDFIYIYIYIYKWGEII